MNNNNTHAFFVRYGRPYVAEIKSKLLTFPEKYRVFDLKIGAWSYMFCSDVDRSVKYTEIDSDKATELMAEYAITYGY